MNNTHEPEVTDIIKSPLWDLMLSTNDCYPGCGCEYDIFDMTASRVKPWVLKNDYKLSLTQLDQLISNSDIDIGDIQLQTGIPFQKFDEFKNWLLIWKELIKKISNS